MRKKYIIFFISATLLICSITGCKRVKAPSAQEKIKVSKNTDKNKKENNKINKENKGKYSKISDKKEINGMLRNISKKHNKDDFENKNDTNNLDFPATESIFLENLEDNDEKTKTIVNTKRDSEDLAKAISRILDENSSGKLVNIEVNKNRAEYLNNYKDINSFIVTITKPAEILIYFGEYLKNPNTVYKLVRESELEDNKIDPYNLIEIIEARFRNEKIKTIDIDYIEYTEYPAFVFTFLKNNEVDIDTLVEKLNTTIKDNAPKKQEEIDK